MMKKVRTIICIIFLLTFNIFAQTAKDKSEDEGFNPNPEAAKIITSDIDLFWKAFDRATPENDLVVYRDEYLKKGSIGLKEFWRTRIGSPCELAGALNYAPDYYASLRVQSKKVDSYKPQMQKSFRRLKEIYPDAVFPDVYFLIGRMSSAGTLTDKGLLIGLDMFGKTDEKSLEKMSDWHKAVLSTIDRTPYIVAHELIHYQQKHPSTDKTLLRRAIGEGSADFIGELISGGQINPHLHKYGNPIEKDLWNEFRQEMDGTDSSNWLYQGDKAKKRPADLGYYIGYKIVESYYKNAGDKNQAVKDILEIKDFQKFLADSRYEKKFR
jgi:hypothetical protein